MNLKHQKPQLLLLLLLLGSLQLVTAAAATSHFEGNGFSSLLRGGTQKKKQKASPIARLLGSFSYPGAGSDGSGSDAAPQRGGTRLNTLVPAAAESAVPPSTSPPVAVPAAPVPVPVPAPSSVPATSTQPPTNRPTLSPRSQHPEIGTGDGTTPMLQQVIPLLQQGADQIEPLLGANSTYKLGHLLNALEWSYEWETGVSHKKSMGIIDRNRDRNRNRNRHLQDSRRVMDLGGERVGMGGPVGSLKVAMAHIAVLLGTAWHAGFHTGMCDEPNHNATDTKNPGCGQDGLNYRYPFDGFAEEGFGCFQNDQEWLTGTPAGCAVQPTAVKTIVSDAKEPERQLMCGVGLENLESRDCCWWGRGMLQMTHQCDYGDYQANWGSSSQASSVPDRPAVDLCGNPGQVCSDEYPELRFLTGLYLWVRDVIHAEDTSFNFTQELQAWVDGKMDMRKNGNFVDRVGGVLIYGDATLLPPDYRQRRSTVEAALDTIMSLAPTVMEKPTYGNLAMCKKAVQSSIMDYGVASNAVDGIIDSPNISHTLCEEKAWWKVDLETPHEIYSIAVVNRQDCCFERLDHVMIELLDEDGYLIPENHTVQHDPNMEGQIVNVWTVDYEVPPIASQVRISVKAPPGKCDYLNLAEVQVFGYCQFGDACMTGRGCHLENIAQCKKTEQSSTATNGGASSVAVDGNVAGTEEELASGTNVAVSVTECEQDPYWQVDLMARQNISMVAVFIPGDSTKMNGLLVELLDDTGAVVTSKQHDASGTGPIGNVAIFEMENDVVEHLASIVRLRLPGNSGGACGTLELAEVQVFSDCWDGASCVTWPSCSYENAAECKAATQSSTYEGGVAWKAIDGHQALSHTKCEEEPWWEVDLLSDYPVTEVILYNRKDCCYDRLNGVVIELKDINGDTVMSVQHDPATDGVIEDSWSVNFHENVARKVRVMVQHEPDTCGYLNLRDIQVMRTCVPGEECSSWSHCKTGNTAQCKPTTQSSTFFGDVSAQAVDGDESLAHTDCELNPWWGVNLLVSRTVSHVVVHNREDCCYERLNGLLVQLFNEQDEVLGEIQHNLETDGLIDTMWIATFEPPVQNVRKVFLSTSHPEGFCEFLNLAEVEVMSECLEGDACQTGFGCDKGNVGLCKPARQSSTEAKRLGDALEVGVAGKGVDGKESLSHTECEQNPWWEVNLLGVREISEVILHNRQDCCFERLNGALVELLDEAGSVVASAQHDPNVDGMIEYSWVAIFDDVGASRVRVSTNAGEGPCTYLNLADVEVISTCVDGDACKTMEECIYGNVAQCKPSRQISTKDGFVADNAVNGRDALAHTDCEENPWWEVDLLSAYHVSEVIIFNRMDCCIERLNYVLVELLDKNGTTLASLQHDPGRDGLIEDKWTANFNPFDFILSSKVRVSVKHNPGTCEFLNIADVQVMSVCQEGDACLTGARCDHGNVAQCKKAEQSSTRDGAAAIKATDGEETISMTECEADPWWLVDLETRRDVSEVVVYNRRDCCQEQLNGVKLELLDSFSNVLTTAQHDVMVSGPINDVWSVKFEEENVRYVRISTHHVNGTCAPLDLAEVHVMSLCEENDACLTGFDCENVELEKPNDEV